MTTSRPRFERLRPEKLHEQVLERVRTALITGDYLPGDRLRENDIAEQMGVSRGPIREAFRQLEQEGLIVSQPHRGTYVATTSAEEFEHLVQVRALLEGYAIRHAVKRATPEHVAELQAVIQRLKAAVATMNLPEVAECVVTVHRTIVDLAGSPILARMWSTLTVLVRNREFVMFRQTPDPESIAEEAVSHERVVHALASGDPDQAERAVVADISRRTRHRERNSQSLDGA
jgi:DNA-binding GntR family transcriptional regulator